MATIQASSKTIARVGIVGCGNIASLWDENKSGKGSAPAKTHAKAFSRFKKSQIVVFMDQDIRRAKKAAAFWKVKNFTDQIADVNSQKLDILCLCTPEVARLSILKQVTGRKGMVIVCEKPLASTIDEASAIVQFCKDRGWQLLVNFVRTYGEDLRVVRKMVEQRKLGAFEKIISNYGKGLRNNGSHMLHLILQLAGNPVSGSRLKSFPDERAETADPTLDLILNFAKGTETFSAYITANHHQSFNVFELDLFFNRGRIKISERGNKIEIFKSTSDKEYPGYKVLKVDKVLTKGLKNYFENLAQEAVNLSRGTGQSALLEPVILSQQIIESIQQRGSYGI
jgi:predicted dehydrogenase